MIAYCEFSKFAVSRISLLFYHPAKRIISIDRRQIAFDCLGEIPKPVIPVVYLRPVRSGTVNQRAFLFLCL